MDPFVNLHNCALDDEPLAIAELGAFAREGGRTVVDPTCRGIGRDPRALARISGATGLQIIMGAGYYLASSHPPSVKAMSAEAIADEIVEEALDGVDGSGILIGLIGEIGVSSDFTADEEKSLRGAAQAQRRTGLPLMVHLPGWFRHAHRVLDTVEEEGGDVRQTVLCHMNPSGQDQDYQTSLGARGAFLEYDMIGMDYFYADQGVQCPSDDDNARAIRSLIDAGFLDRILLSHDVFLKMMLTPLRRLRLRLRRSPLPAAPEAVRRLRRADPHHDGVQPPPGLRGPDLTGEIMSKKQVLLVGWLTAEAGGARSA